MSAEIYPYVRTESNIIFVCFGRPLDAEIPREYQDGRKIIDLTRYCLEKNDPWEDCDGPQSA